MNPFALISLALALFALPAHGASCNARSGPQRVALLELYTSEGCDSCPPTDRWVSALPARGLGTGRVLTLAYHVDYWNYLGWRDPFAQARFSERQRFANARVGSRTVYTPQLMLGGRDYRRSSVGDAFATDIAAINREPPGADIALSMVFGDGRIESAARVTPRRNPSAAAVFLALYENRLANQVRAGENKGKRLEHDFVVRELAGPFAADTTQAVKHTFRVAPDWKPRDLALAAFVQAAATGEVLQALALPACH